MTDIVQKILCISTRHAPSPDPDFGSLRLSDTEYGWVVWPYTEVSAPDWLKPIVKYANEKGCFAIEFDADNPVCEEFEVYEW